jgi:hypothetical protein
MDTLHKGDIVDDDDDDDNNNNNNNNLMGKFWNIFCISPLSYWSALSQRWY